MHESEKWKWSRSGMSHIVGIGFTIWATREVWLYVYMYIYRLYVCNYMYILDKLIHVQTKQILCKEVAFKQLWDF